MTKTKKLQEALLAAREQNIALRLGLITAFQELESMGYCSASVEEQWTVLTGEEEMPVYHVPGRPN